MNTVIFIIIIIAFLWNVLSYVASYCLWCRDCKEIGKDKLAVSLRERMTAVFFTTTFPCIIGFVIAIIKK